MSRKYILIVLFNFWDAPDKFILFCDARMLDRVLTFRLARDWEAVPIVNLTWQDFFYPRKIGVICTRLTTWSIHQIFDEQSSSKRVFWHSSRSQRPRGKRHVLGLKMLVTLTLFLTRKSSHSRGNITY